MRVLYHLPLSPYARKVRLVLAEKRLPFELRTEKVWMQRPEFLALNPASSVPVLVEDNGLVIPDSGVICEYRRLRATACCCRSCLSTFAVFSSLHEI